MNEDEDVLLRSVALQNAKAILLARQRAERELIEAKEALRATTERLQVALAAGHLGYWTWDAATDLVTLSEEARVIFGVTGTTVPWSILRAGDDADVERQAFQAALHDNADYDAELRVGDRWIVAKGRGTYAGEGHVTGMIGVVQDQTERKRVELALRDREEWLRATFSQAAVGFAVAALDGRFEQANLKFSKILGYSEEELRQLTFADVTHPDDREETGQRILTLLAGEAPEVRYEKRYRHRDGSDVWSLSTVTLLKDAAGQARRFIGVIEDIGQRKRAELALLEETRVLEVLNRSGAAIASELDLDGLLDTVTDAATELTGAQFGAFYYTTGADASFELRAVSGATVEALLQLGVPREFGVFPPTFGGEAVVRAADVSTDPRFASLATVGFRSYLAVPVISRSREVFGGLLFGHVRPDRFTARGERLVVGVAAQAAIAIDNARLYEGAQKAAEERQQLLEREQTARAHAERMSELKDEFLATLSHELRTPLGAILGWSQVIRTRDLGPTELQHAVEVIERNARAQARLVEDLLDMARIRSGQVRLDVQSLDAGVVLDNALETLAPAAEAKGIRMIKEVDPGMGPIWGDASRLQQVVWNLLSNAIKFTPKRGEVRVVMAREASYTNLSVCDTGIGIPQEFLPYVFDRFRQADASSTRVHGGLGLGLAIARQLVELHGGSIRVESAGDGAGTTFTVLLPLSPDQPTTPSSVR